MNRALLSSNTNEWSTPRAFFAALDAEFHFNLDPCSTRENRKCAKFFTIEDDGLQQDWGGVSCILQPALRTGNRRLGPQVFRGGKETRNPRRYAYSGPDRYGVFPRLYLQPRPGNPVCSRPTPFQRGRTRAVPVDGCCFLIVPGYDIRNIQY